MVLLVSLYLFFPSTIQPAQLPLKKYTAADGLPHNIVNRIVRDSRGFLWFCTEEGLSRFDGYQFVNYTTEQGLPHPHVKDLLETREGIYWVATGKGLCRFNPKGSQISVDNSRYRHSPLTRSAVRQTTLSPKGGEGVKESKANPEAMFDLVTPADNQGTGTVNVLFEDKNGTVWCGTGGGLFQLQRAGGQWTLSLVDIGLPKAREADSIVQAIVQDRGGALWIGVGSGLYRRWTDGRTERYTTHHGLPVEEVRALAIDSQGLLWAGTIHGVCQIVSDPHSDRTIVARVYREADGLPSDNIRSLLRSPHGGVWVGTTFALVELVPKPSSNLAKSPGHSVVPIIVSPHVMAIAESPDQSLWLGTDGGAIKWVRNGFTTYQGGDGLGSVVISSIFETQAGEVCASSASKRILIDCFDGKKFGSTRPNLPERLSNLGWGWSQLTLQAKLGEWWVPTGEGLFRFPPPRRTRDLASAKPRAVYSSKNGLPVNEVFRLYEDSRGDLWIATFSEANNWISRFQRRSERLQTFSTADSLPSLLPIIRAFAEDRLGNLWIGLEQATLVRYSDGHFRVFGEDDGVPPGDISALHLDRNGRLWLGSSVSGLVCIEDTPADPPHFLAYGKREGLSSSSIFCITEDHWGRIYVGSGSGVDRFDQASGRVKHYSESDGVAGGEIKSAFCDRNGSLWFGSNQGVSRLVPEADMPQSVPPVLLTRVRVAGTVRPISEVGETEVAGLELGPNQSNLQIDFVAPGSGTGEELSYQYKLEGADRDWSAPTTLRSVNFASLAPGAYRFLVRALSPEGRASHNPAVVSFTILRPVWRRGWFLILAGLFLFSLAYAAHRLRLKRLLELEAIRMRIATDLHDDIGSNLSEIAILSEVLSQQVSADNPKVIEPLSTIAGTSRELVDSMSDIVWAINPRKDQLRDLTQRMRQFSSNLFTARSITFRFNTPAVQDTNIGADVRRQVYLIFKESLNNMVRHSACTEADIQFTVQDGQLSLTLKDNGKGLLREQVDSGHGLDSMKARAKSLGGTLQISSAVGNGTTVSLVVPLDRHLRTLPWRKYLPV
jgi:ligand-binding sensor domain-containing protein/signal transduction histidine kinase